MQGKRSKISKSSKSADTLPAGSKLKLIINDKKYEFTFGEDIPQWDVNAYDVYPWDTLLYTLRDKLHLTGTKDGCNQGACGACTVLIDGKTALACMTLTADLDGKTVTTIEGIGQPGNLHPIQQAFVENHGTQCGFCAPGMVISTKALLGKNPHPNTDEIKQGLSGNLCRCGNYTWIIKAVQDAAGKMDKRG